MKKKALSLLLTFAMLLSFVPTFGISAAALTPVHYQNWDGSAFVDATCNTYTEIDNSFTTTSWSAGWYYVTGNDVQIAGTVTITGDVNLILADGAMLTVTGAEGAAGTAGVDNVNDGDGGTGGAGGAAVSISSGSLTIYAQSNDSNTGRAIFTGGAGGEGGEGALFGSCNGNGGAGGTGGTGIGGSGNLTVNGGNVSVNGGKGGSGGKSYMNKVSGGVGGAGGCGGAGVNSNANLTANGGSLTVNGGAGGSGGDGKSDDGYGSVGAHAIMTDQTVTININGGTTSVTGGKTAENSHPSEDSQKNGIACSNATINVAGGSLTASGEIAIECNALTVTDGTVTADGTSYGTSCNSVSITGGTVNAKGTEAAVNAVNPLTLTNMEVIGANEDYVAGSTKELTNKSGTEYVTVNSVATNTMEAAFVNSAGEAQTPVTATIVAGTDTDWGKAGKTTWYVANGTITITNTVTITGDVNLILADGANLTVTAEDNSQKAGINVTGGNTLTIYAQSMKDSTMGVLTANGDSHSSLSGAGIGGNANESNGAITINGGKVTANGGDHAAGIGGGDRSGNCGNITINGGIVTATSPTYAAGIGTGYGQTYNDHATNISITGGIVTATGGHGGGAGIGGGYFAYATDISITGGTVTATGRDGGAGIGCGPGAKTAASGITIADSMIVKADNSTPPTTVIEDISGTFNVDVSSAKRYVTTEYPTYTIKSGGLYTGTNTIRTKLPTGRTTTTKIVFHPNYSGTLPKGTDLQYGGGGNIVGVKNGTVCDIYCNGNIAFAADCRYLFNGMTALTEIEGLELVDTSAVTDIRGMFCNCHELKSVNLSAFNLTSATVGSDVFVGCDNLTTIELGEGWDFSGKGENRVSGFDFPANDSGWVCFAGANSGNLYAASEIPNGAGSYEKNILGNVKMFLDETCQLTAASALENALWECSDTSVVTIEANNVLTPHKLGTAKVTVTSGEKLYGICNVSVVEPVAAIGSNRYASIADALAADYTGETEDNPTVIELINNDEENVTIPSGRYITLDLNGYVLKSADGNRNISNYGMLTISDSNTSTVHYFTDEKCSHNVPVGEACELCGTCEHGVKYSTYCNDCECVVTTIVKDKIAKKDGCFETLYSGVGTPVGSLGTDYVSVSGGCITGGGIWNIGELYLTGGSITGNSYVYFGGGVDNYKGTFTMTGGSITGNNAVFGGGVMNDGGTFTMTGGSITGNNADYGCGVYNNGTFTMTDGSITGNNAVSGGGVFNNSTFTMTDGSITGNSVGYAGGGVINTGTLKLGGTAEISGNAATIGNNLLTADPSIATSNEPITLGTGDNGVPVPAWTTPIGVTMADEDINPTAGAFTTANSSDYSGFFTSDDEDYAVVNEGTGSEQVLKLIVHVHSWTYSVKSDTTDTLLATCTEAATHHGTNPEKITLVKPERTYIGDTDKSEKATITGTALGEYTVSADEIKYTGIGDTDYAESTTAPTEAGSYKACITVGGVTAYVEYTISSEPTTYTIKSGGYYTGTNTIRTKLPTGRTTTTKIVFHPNYSGTLPKGTDIQYGGGGNIVAVKNGTVCDIYCKCNIAFDANCRNMFSGMTALTEIEGLELVGTSAVTDIRGMFANCRALKSVNLSAFNLTSATVGSDVFVGCDNLTTIELGEGWDFSGKGKNRVSGFNFPANESGWVCFAGANSGNLYAASEIPNGAGSYEKNILNVGNVGMFLDETCQLTAASALENALWECSDTSVVTIEANNVLTPHKLGTAKITVTSEGKLYGICNVLVVEPVAAIDSNRYASIADALAADHTGETEDNPTVIKLINDDEENVVIPSGRYITLDLNGYVLKSPNGNRTVDNDGMLTISDSNTSTVHYFTNEECVHGVPIGEACEYCGTCEHGVKYLNYCTDCECIVTTIVKNKIAKKDDCFETLYSGEGTPAGSLGTDYVSVSGGCITGGGILNTGKLYLTGGSIAGNNTHSSGGGVNNYGTFTMTGGSITGNSAGDVGGGVYNNSTFTMTGGSITGNSAGYIGGGVVNADVLKLGGTAEISGNTGTIGNNLLTADPSIDTSYEPITLGTGDNGVPVPEWTTPIGVTMCDYDFNPTAGAFTTANSADYSGFFTSDDANYTIYNEGTGNEQVLYIYAVIAKIVETGKVYPSVQTAVDSATSGQTVMMIADSAEYVEVDNTKNITLDLNGYVLMGDGSSIIENSGTLTVKDSNTGNRTHYFTYYKDSSWELKDSATEEEKSAATALQNVTATTENGTLVAVTGGCISYREIIKTIQYATTFTYDLSNTAAAYQYEWIRGGGIYNEGTLNLTGGNIIGNYGDYGGGIYNKKELNISGGNIIGNYGDYSGGGVYVYNDGTLTISEGSITKNYSYDYGGGVYNKGIFTMTGGSITDNYSWSGGGVINYKGTFTMTGGSITGNNAVGGGGLTNTGTLKLGGTAEISGNTGTIGNNIMTADPSIYTSVEPITLGTGDNGVPVPAWTTPIGVTMIDYDDNPTAGAFTTANGADYSGKFISESDSYIVYNGSNNTLELVVPVAAIGGTEYASVQAAINAASTGDTVKMLKNSTENLTIESDKELTLDLNGCVLKGTGSACVIKNNGTLTIKDTNTDKPRHYFTEGSNMLWVWNGDDCVTESFVEGGVITGANSTDWGGGIYNNGTLTAENINIIGNSTSKRGGGICNEWDSSSTVTGCYIAHNYATEGFGGIEYDGARNIKTAKHTLSGSTVANNYSPADGGGIGFSIYLNEGDKYNVTITDCRVYGNHADGKGGGIIVYGANTVTIIGGEFVNNTSNGTGGGINNEGTLYLGGSIKVTGNKTGTEDNNLYLASGKTVTVSTENPLTTGALIGVKTYSTPTAGNPVAVSGNNNADYSSYFASDNESYKAYSIGSGANRVVKLSTHEHVWIYKADGATMSAWCGETFGTCDSSNNSEANADTLTIQAPASPMYDGTEKAATLSQATLAGVTTMPDIEYEGIGSTSYSKSTTAPTNAGSYRASITVGGTTASVDYTIAKRDVTLSSESAAQKYTGEALEKSTVNVSGSGFVAGEVTDITATGSITSVGEVTNTISYTTGTDFDESNYNITKVEGKLVVTEGDIAVIGRDYNGVYDGKAHGEAAQVFYTKTESTSAVVDYYTSASETGPWGYWGNEAPTITDVGKLWVLATATNNNCNPKSDDCIYSLTVTEAPLLVTIPGASKVYDSNALTATNYTVAGLVNDETVTVNVTGTRTDVGSSENTYEINWNGTAKSDNYALTVVPGTLLITESTPEITAPVASAITYGQQLSESTLSGGSSGGIEGSFAWKNGAVVPSVSDSGVTEYTVVFTPTDADNYSAVECNVTLTVNRKALTVTGTTANNKQYNGKTDATATVGTIGGKVGTDKVNVTIDSATFDSKDIGTDKTVTVSYSISGADAGNYTIPANDELTASIVQRELTVTGTIVNNKIYDGTANATATVGELGMGSGVVSGENVTVSVTSASFDGVDAEENKPVTVSYTLGGTEAGNYTVSDETLTATIYPRSIATDATITGIKENYTYSGIVIHPTPDSVTVGGMTATHKESYPSNGNYKSVGTGYQVVIVGTGNFTGTVTKTFNITAKSSAIGVNAIADQTYTGSAREPAITVIDNEGNTLTKGRDYTVTYTDNTEVGTAKVAVTGINGYATLNAETTFNILKVKVDVPTAVTGLIFSDAEQTGVVLPDGAVYTLSGNEATDAGSYTAYATLNDPTSYEWNLDTPTTEDRAIAWSIAKQEVSAADITIENKAYTGEALTADVDCEGKQYTVKTNNGGTGAGTYDVVLSLTDPVNYKWTDSDEADKTLEFKITKAENSWTTEPKIENVTYGTAISPVGAAKFGTATVTYEGTGSTNYAACSTEPTNAGTYKATFTVAETNDYGSLTKTVQFTIDAVAQEAPATASYTTTVSDAANGTVTVSPKNACAGNTVSLTVTPDKGYTLETITVTDKNGNEVTLTPVTYGEKYTFKMPASAVTIKATFMEDNTMLNFFVDVNASDYYYDATLWAAENGITSGIDSTHFAPANITTRAQMVTFLWRLAGSPESSLTSCKFTDVSENAYYYKAVLWAVEKGITEGTSETTFSPDVNVSRCQTVTFLWRYSGKPTVTAENPFTDVKSGTYYYEAVLWAKAQGITEGTGTGTFSPSAACTRGQIVTFLYRSVLK